MLFARTLEGRISEITARLQGLEQDRAQLLARGSGEAADREQIEREVAEAEYMRYAAGGFARASSAAQAPNGTYLPK